MDIRTYVRAVDALIARGEPITSQNLDEVADELRRADRGRTPQPPSLPGQDFRIRVRASSENAQAYDSDWVDYVQRLHSRGYEIRWSSTSASELSGPVDDDGTGYSHDPASPPADGGGPYVLQPPSAPSPQPPSQQGLGAELRDVLDRAKNALYRGTATERSRRTQRRNGTTTDDGPALDQ